MNVLVINRAASWMRVWLVLGFVIMTSPVFGTLTTGTEGGTLTSNPTPINPLAYFTLSYAGAGTNFATWAACNA